MRHIRGRKYYALKLLSQYSAKRNNMLNLAYILKSDTHIIIFFYIKLGDVVTIETTFLFFYVLFFALHCMLDIPNVLSHLVAIV